MILKNVDTDGAFDNSTNFWYQQKRRWKYIISIRLFYDDLDDTIFCLAYIRSRWNYRKWYTRSKIWFKWNSKHTIFNLLEIITCNLF